MPISSEVISWKTLERLRVETVADGGTGASSSVEKGTWNVNLRAGNVPGIGTGSAALVIGGTKETIEDLAFSSNGDGFGVSNG